MMRFYRKISDYLAVGLVTIAIWLYAEGRNVQSYSPAEDVPLSVELSSPNLVVTSQSTDRVKIDFKGALSEIDKLRRELPTGLVLRLEQAAPGEQTLVLSRALARAQPLDRLGVNVTSVEPATLTIATDRLVRHSVELVFSPADVQLIPETLSIKPASIEIRLPEGRLPALQAGSDRLTLAVEAASDLQALAPGREHTVVGRAVLPAALRQDPNVRLQESTIELTFTIDKKEDTITLPSVPVWALTPPDASNSFQVKLEADSQLIRDVTVSGPAEMIRQIRAGTLPVIAVLRLNSDALARATGKPTTAAITFDVPAPLQVISSVNTAKFTVIRRGN